MFVLPWPPREGVDAIKSEHVINAKEMKNSTDSADTLAPPFEIVCAHSVPAIKRNTPVLAPLLRKHVLFEIRLGRRAAAPVEHKFIRPREHVGTVITNAKRNIAH